MNFWKITADVPFKNYEYFCNELHFLRQLGQKWKLARAWNWTTKDKYSLSRSMKHTLKVKNTFIEYFFRYILLYFRIKLNTRYVWQNMIFLHLNCQLTLAFSFDSLMHVFHVLSTFVHGILSTKYFQMYLSTKKINKICTISQSQSPKQSQPNEWMIWS